MTIPPAPVAEVHSGGGGSMGIVQGTGFAVMAVLGTGIISLPSLAARTAGPASLVAWVALVLVSAPLALTIAALAARSPDAGGTSTYVREAFGRYAATVVGWCFFFVVPVAAPAAAMFAGAYVEAAWGGGSAAVGGTAVAVLLIVWALNSFGRALSARVQVALCVGLVVGLAGCITLALPHARMSNLHPVAPHGWLSIGPAAAIVAWGFTGWEAMTHLAGEFRDPRRVLPRVTLLALLVVGSLYVAISLMTLLVLGPAAGQTNAPLTVLLQTSLETSVAPVMAGVAVLLTVGVVNVYVRGGARLGASLARERSFPRALAAPEDAAKVPRRSLNTLVALALVGTLIGSTTWGLDAAVVMSTACFALIYVLVTAAALRLLPRRSAAWWWAIIAFVCSCGLISLTGAHLSWAAGIALCGCAHEWLRSRRAEVSV
jgi:amino acid efflux transporter